MARRQLYGALWKSFEVVLELVNDIALRLNTEAADDGRDQVNRSSAASSGYLAELADDHANSILFDTEVKADFASYKAWGDALKTRCVTPPNFERDTNFDFQNGDAFEIEVAGVQKTVATDLSFDTGTATVIATNAYWAAALLSMDVDGTTSYVDWGAEDVAEAGAITNLAVVTASGAVVCGYATLHAKAGEDWVAGTDAVTGGTGGQVAQTTNYFNDQYVGDAVLTPPAAMSNVPNPTLTATAIGSDGRLGIAMAVHGTNAENVKFDNAIYYQILGQTYFKDVDAEIDISAECVGTGDTISAGLHGAMWMMVAADGTVDGENDKAAADYASAVLALAQYSIATNTLPVADHVPVGVIQILESAGGGFTWGTDSITAETETYYSFEGLPGIESAIASFALDAGLTTVTYGAATIMLGTGVRVTLTGKAALAFTGTTVVAVGKTGAYLLYALADDTEVLVTATSTANDLQAAKDLVRDLAPNPLMPLLGVVYVTARLNAFTPGTTLLDLNGIDTVFVTTGVTTDRQEYGRSSGSTFTPIDEVLTNAAKVGQNRRP